MPADTQRRTVQAIAVDLLAAKVNVLLLEGEFHTAVGGKSSEQTTEERRSDIVEARCIVCGDPFGVGCCEFGRGS